MKMTLDAGHSSKIAVDDLAEEECVHPLWDLIYSNYDDPTPIPGHSNASSQPFRWVWQVSSSYSQCGDLPSLHSSRRNVHHRWRCTVHSGARKSKLQPSSAYSGWQTRLTARRNFIALRRCRILTLPLLLPHFFLFSYINGPFLFKSKFRVSSTSLHPLSLRHIRLV